MDNSQRLAQAASSKDVRGVKAVLNSIHEGRRAIDIELALALLASVPNAGVEVGVLLSELRANDKIGLRPLQEALKHKNAEVIRRLLRSGRLGPPLDARSITAAMVTDPRYPRGIDDAAEVEAVRLLLSYPEYDPRADPYLQTALHSALNLAAGYDCFEYAKNEGMVLALLNDPRVVQSNNVDWPKLLQEAVDVSSPDIVERLLALQRTSLRLGPPKWDLRKGPNQGRRADVVNILLRDPRFDVQQALAPQWLPTRVFMQAVERDYEDVVRAFLKHMDPAASSTVRGVAQEAARYDVDTVKKVAYWPGFASRRFRNALLHFAAFEQRVGDESLCKGRPDIVRYLLACTDADMEQAELGIALSKWRWPFSHKSEGEIVQLLENYGAIKPENNRVTASVALQEALLAQNYARAKRLLDFVHPNILDIIPFVEAANLDAILCLMQDAEFELVSRLPKGPKRFDLVRDLALVNPTLVKKHFDGPRRATLTEAERAVLDTTTHGVFRTRGPTSPPPEVVEYASQFLFYDPSRRY